MRTEEVVDLIGIEPTTSSLQMSYSISYGIFFGYF